jgi:hypothetical protein
MPCARRAEDWADVNSVIVRRLGSDVALSTRSRTTSFTTAANASGRRCAFAVRARLCHGQNSSRGRGDHRVHPYGTLLHDDVVDGPPQARPADGQRPVRQPASVLVDFSTRARSR